METVITHAQVAFARQLLRWSFGLVIVLAGLDKIFGTNLIVHWPQYISPTALPFIENTLGVPLFIVVIGIVEVLVGGMMLTRWPRLAGYLAALWLVIISINLLLLGTIDIALRDILLACACIAMAQLFAGSRTPIPLSDLH